VQGRLDSALATPSARLTGTREACGAGVAGGGHVQHCIGAPGSVANRREIK
jgi:hypothetical protein